MLTFLRKIRKSLIESGSARKYIVYAIGEIALVVIGILMALQINNWNEERLQVMRIDQIFELVIEDMNSDIKEFEQVISRYEEQEHIYLNLMEGDVTRDVVRDSSIILPLIRFGPIIIDKRAYELLKNEVTLIQGGPDSLVSDIIQFYENRSQALEGFVKIMDQECTSFINFLAENQPWYQAILMGSISEHDREKMYLYLKNDPILKNKVYNQWIYVYRNYVPMLKYVIWYYKEFQERIEQRLDT